MSGELAHAKKCNHQVVRKQEVMKDKEGILAFEKDQAGDFVSLY